MNRDEMIKLRTRLIKGEPPYEIDQMGNKVRQKGGLPGIEERKAVGDYSYESTGVRLALETLLQITEHLLERMR